MSHGDYLSFEEFNRRSATPDSHTTPAAVGIAVVAGIATLFKFLDFLGYPVWFWIGQFAHKMALGIVRAVSPAPSLGSEASDDTMQSGGMMGNLFGMGASALSKGVRGVASALSRAPSDLPPGLGNYDNSCYQNSVIQGLASLPSLRAYLTNTTTEHESLTADTTNGALLDMISQLNDPEKRGQHFWIRGKLKSMSTFTQQDAQEYYSRVLDELDKEIKKAARSKRRSSVSWTEAAKSLSLPEAGDKEKESAEEKEEEKEEEKREATEQPNAAPIPLEGSLAQRVGCTTCGYAEGLSLIPFNCITVSLGRNRSGYDVRELLDDHTDLEYIDGVECSKCTLLKLKSTLAPLAATKGPDSPFAARLLAVQEALDDEDLKDTTLTKTFNIPKKNWVKSEKSKQVVIARAPKSLVLHVNRSIFDETTFAQYKNNAGVSYPSTLDLGKWCLGTQPSGSQKPDLDPKTEEWPRDPKTSMLVGADVTTPSPFQYKLRAAVTHFGTHGNGHYVCYRPHPRPVRKAEKEDNDTEEKEDREEKTEKANEEDEAEEEEGEDEEPTLSSEQWYRFSDDTVYAVSEAEAHQGNVFMLFYERIDDSTPLEAANTATETLAVLKDAPLSPTNASTPLEPVEVAVEVPLSSDDDDDDDVIDFTPSEPPAAHPAPPIIASDKATADDTEATEASETELESEAEAPPTPPTPTLPKLSPHTMRTAGNASSRNQGSRASLPLVSAT
ncbi:cysteine proteinase [Macroventuria anomochaeta]|uniref:Cysteine proteinase n=1 Tax=Macroventuria anomochaeta TaxID=301207 RepID=A0ACB6S1F9_9PLEO|nr:cysteine proteinase [Macroventuria anomochaeta]KAF2627342.1 cysteine proteinase [Macroventuria anomochaeta]